MASATSNFRVFLSSWISTHYSQSRKLTKLDNQPSQKCLSGMLKLIVENVRNFVCHIPLICLAHQLLPEDAQERLIDVTYLTDNIRIGLN